MRSFTSVKIIGPSIGHVPHKPSTHDGDGDGFADLNGDGVDKEPVPDVVEKPVGKLTRAASSLLEKLGYQPGTTFWRAKNYKGKYGIRTWGFDDYQAAKSYLEEANWMRVDYDALKKFVGDGKDVDERIMELLRFDDQHITEGFDAFFKERTKGKVQVALTSDALLGIVADGRMHSHQEKWQPHLDDPDSELNGQAKGSVRRRRNVEEKFLGVPDEIPDELRPIYGYLEMPDGSTDKSPERPDGQSAHASFYGPHKLVMKDDVRKRTTVTFGDSEEQQLSAVPLEDEPDLSVDDVLSVVSRGFSRQVKPYVAEAAIKDRELPDEVADTIRSDAKFSLPVEYVAETQIHGGVTLDDIDSVGLDLTDPKAKDVARALEKAGIPWFDISDPKAERRTWDAAKKSDPVDRDPEKVLDALPYKPGNIGPRLTPQQTTNKWQAAMNDWFGGEDVVSHILEYFGGDDDKAKEWWDTTIKDALENTVREAQQGDLSTAVTGGALAKILTDGRFKSQFESGDSNGMFDPAYRGDFERTQLGVPRDIDPELRPIYGLMDNEARDTPVPDNALQYGEHLVTFKDDVRKRTTVTAGDSLNGDASGIPLDRNPGELTASELDKFLGPEAETTMMYLLGEAYGELFEEDFVQDFEFYPEHYNEAQIHGGVTLDDVDSIDIDHQTLHDYPELFDLLFEDNPGFDWGTVSEENNEWPDGAWRRTPLLRDKGIKVQVAEFGGWFTVD
jgi:hypothetical protein